jgi:hypothetical protein
MEGTQQSELFQLLQAQTVVAARGRSYTNQVFSGSGAENVGGSLSSEGLQPWRLSKAGRRRGLNL